MEPCSGCQSVDENVKLMNLSCGHGFCSRCLFQVTKNQYGYMPCPSCRRDTLLSLIASTRYHQLSGSLCKYHVQPLDIYCHICATMVCRICTMLEHRPHYGHMLTNKKNETEDRFKDLFEAIEEVNVAQKRLEDTSNNILFGLYRTMDVTKREINDIESRILDQQHELFREYLSSEWSKINDIFDVVKELKRKASAGAMESKRTGTHLRYIIDKGSSMGNLPTNDCQRYIERPFSSLRCEEPRSRLSVSSGTTPTHFTDWLGEAIGILWALQEQIMLVVDERLDSGEELCIYSFDTLDLGRVMWSHNVKLNNCLSPAVLCQESYRILDELWFWVAVGDKLFQFTLDLRTYGCPMKATRSYYLKLPCNPSGITAIACQLKDNYIDNKFLVTTSSTANSLLTVFSWNGTHEEDIALGRLSSSISDIALRPIDKCLAICDTGSSMVRSFKEESFSSLEQYNYTLSMGNSAAAIPISVTCNRHGDILILWLSSKIRKEDVVYGVWNITAQEQKSRRIFVVAVGSSLETGVPVSLDCWDHDIAVSFKDGRIRIFRNFLSLNARNEDAGEAKAFLTSTKLHKHSRSTRLANIQRTPSLVSHRSKPAKLRRSQTIEL